MDRKKFVYGRNELGWCVCVCCTTLEILFNFWRSWVWFDPGVSVCCLCNRKLSNFAISHIEIERVCSYTQLHQNICLVGRRSWILAVCTVIRLKINDISLLIQYMPCERIKHGMAENISRYFETFQHECFRHILNPTLHRPLPLPTVSYCLLPPLSLPNASYGLLPTPFR